MNLLLILQKLWRYKFVTLPILAFVLVGAFYVIAIKTPVYEAGSTYILVNPPAPPSESAIARDPRVADGSDNPYTRYSDQSVVVQVLAERLSSEEARAALERRGADPKYTVAPSPEFGYSAPILQISGTGSSEAAAVRTANLVGEAVTKELDQMQEAQRVSPRYRIVTQPVVAPHNAKLKASGKLRALVAVFALGLVLLFIVISVAEALAALRKERGRDPIEDGLGFPIAVGAPVEPLVPVGGNGEPRRRARRRRGGSLQDPDVDLTGR